MKYLLFVYGTLKKGFRLHKQYQMDKQEFVRKDYILGQLWSTRSYPVLTLGDKRVAGEIYSLDIVSFRRIVQMEIRVGYSLGMVYTESGLPVNVFIYESLSVKKLSPITEWTQE